MYVVVSDRSMPLSLCLYLPLYVYVALLCMCARVCVCANNVVPYEPLLVADIFTFIHVDVPSLAETQQERDSRTVLPYVLPVLH